MSRRSLTLTLFMASAWLATACAPARSAPLPAPVPTYASTLAAAQKRADSGDYAGADRILADFALRAPNKAEAHEISFWRALYLVDPSNRSSSPEEGIRALDIYLKTQGTVNYRPQALVLKRTAQTVQTLRQASQVIPKVNGRDTVFVNREDEIVALRDQLAKANAELERIKRRLANPGR